MSEPDVDSKLDPLVQSLDCLRSVRFITENPKWMLNILVLAGCQFIPILGPLATMGYQFEVAEALLRRPNSAEYPDFDFNKFVEYLVCGIYQFLAALFASIVMMFVIGILSLPLVVGFAVIGNSDQVSTLALIGMGVGLIVLTALMIFGQILLIPIMLRAGYSQDIGQVFEVEFVKDFVRLMWKESLIAYAFLMLLMVALLFLGFLLCFIGIYLVGGIFLLAQAHLVDYQLYAIYLSRGGKPIPIKPMALHAKAQ